MRSAAGSVSSTRKVDRRGIGIFRSWLLNEGRNLQLRLQGKLQVSPLRCAPVEMDNVCRSPQFAALLTVDPA